MRNYQFKVRPYGRKWSQVLVYHTNQLIKSYIVAASYQGGNVPEFISKHQHIEQFVIQYQDIAQDLMLNVNDK